MTSHVVTTFVAVCPRTGVHLRPATFEETCSWYAGNPRRHFEKMVRVGDVLIDQDTGPGLWFGGAGF